MNIITHQPQNSPIPIARTIGDDHHAARKRMARETLKFIKKWDQQNFVYYLSEYFDPKVYGTFQSMEESQLEQIERKHYLNLPIHEVTRDEYWDALECLPPLHWNGDQFLMREFHTRTFTQMYKKIGDRYYSKMVDAYDKTTWNWKPQPKST